MTKTISQIQPIITFGIPLSIFGLLFLITKSSFFVDAPSGFSAALTLDLVLTVPVVYFLLIRKKEIPKTTVIPAFIVGIVIATLIIPQDQQQLLSVVKQWVLPVVEISVLTFIIFKVRKTIQLFKARKGVTIDFLTTLKSVAREVLPGKISSAFATEIAAIYYTFFVLKKRKLSSSEFSYHVEGGAKMILGVFIFLILIETFAMHLLLAQWSILAAWILTGLSLYTVFQIIAILKSLGQRPISISNTYLHLKYGLLGDSVLPISTIESVEVSSKSIEFDETTRHLSPLQDMDPHNVVIQLKESQVLEGFYGLKKSFKIIALHVDDKNRFKQILDQKLSKI